MIYIFYNKVLLRILVLLCGLGVGLCAWKYIALSAEKLPGQGARDALAIVSFLVAGWLVMLIAEVVDQHYVRAFAALCVMLGGYVSYRWIFLVDGPKLITLPEGGSGMQQIHLGFWSAMALAALMLLILVVRLILDKASYGRRPLPAAQAASAISQPQQAQVAEQQAQTLRSGELPPIPVDSSPLNVSSTPVQPSSAGSAPARSPAPVKRLTAIGGLYLGNTYELSPGEHSIGRQGTEILLADDNQVSRSHAALHVDDSGMATLRDTGSTNGTFVNEQRVDSMQLAPGDIVRIGTNQFKVEA